MRFTDLFVKRPVLAIVVNLVILIAGLQSIRSLSVRQYPRSDIAIIRVSTVYVGANADLVRGFITTPLERVIASADVNARRGARTSGGVSMISRHACFSARKWPARLPLGPSARPLGEFSDEPFTAENVALVKSGCPITASGVIRPLWFTGRG